MDNCNVPLAAVKIDEHVCVCSANGGLHLLDKLSAFIFYRAWAGKQAPEIAAEICDQYEIDLQQATNDVTALLRQFDALTLLCEPKQHSRPWGDVLQVAENQDIKQVAGIDSPLSQNHYSLGQKAICVRYWDESMRKAVMPVIQHLEQAASNTSKVDLNVDLYQDDTCGKYTVAANQKIHAFDSIDEVLENVQWFMIECAYRGGDWLTVLHSSALLPPRANTRDAKMQKAVVFAAAKGSGKSTLTYLLQQVGFQFLSDDVVPVDKAGQLSPMPMCQRLKTGSWPLLDASSAAQAISVYARNDGQEVKYVPPMSGNQALWQRHFTIGAIVFPKYNADDKPYTLQPLTAIEALHLLCASGSVFGGALSQLQLQILIDWIVNTPTYRLSYSKFSENMSSEIQNILCET